MRLWRSEAALSKVAFWSAVLTAVFGALALGPKFPSSFGALAILTGLLGSVAGTRLGHLGGASLVIANSRAAEAADDARKLKASLRDRRLTDQQVTTIVDELGGKEIQSILVAFDMKDPEATAYRADFKAAFDQLSIETGFFGGVPRSVIGLGLSTSQALAHEKEIVAAALKAAGVPFYEFAETTNDGWLSKSVTLVVGAKPSIDQANTIAAISGGVGGK